MIVSINDTLLNVKEVAAVTLISTHIGTSDVVASFDVLFKNSNHKVTIGYSAPITTSDTSSRSMHATVKQIASGATSTISGRQLLEEVVLPKVRVFRRSLEDLLL